MMITLGILVANRINFCDSKFPHHLLSLSCTTLSDIALLVSLAAPEKYLKQILLATYRISLNISSI